MGHATTHGSLIYLVRHAIAAEPGPDWPDDGLRPLTNHGIARMRTAAAGLHAMGLRIDAILSSPLVRAAETSLLLVEPMKHKPAVVEAPELAPGYTNDNIAAAIERERSRGTLAVVGHEPGLGQFAAWLLGAQQAVAFKKGGVCCLELGSRVTAGSATLHWMALPKMLRALGH